MEQDKAKVVAFLGPIASYTHQVSDGTYSFAYLARYKHLAKDKLAQVRMQEVEV